MQILGSRSVSGLVPLYTFLFMAQSLPVVSLAESIFSCRADKKRKDTKCTYNVKLMYVSAIVVTMEKQ